jgi:NAD(P)-binding Rossmann-like domain
MAQSDIQASIEADYLIIGAGAAGIGFADVLVSETNSTVAIIDKRASPGGHWNDAYPFVRLHHPSHYYGVHSRPLGDLSKQRAGLNKGLLQVASGAELVAYYDDVMQQHLLPSGRVTYVPMSSYDGKGQITSLLTGAKTNVKVGKKTVDGTMSGTTVPSTHKRGFSIAEGVRCIPLNDLPRVSQPPAGGYVVVGSGKTGMDAALWLLDNGVAPDQIRWIMPRDAWWLDRAKAQFHPDYFAASVGNVAEQMDALATATSVDDLFHRLEACGGLLRLDPNVTPTMFHGATATHAELAALRHIKDVIRMGRVQRIEADKIVLDRGTVPAKADTLYVDCSAAGFAVTRPVPVFGEGKITLQMLKSFQPTFSAALIAHIEGKYADDAQKNAFCTPVAPPKHATDWLPMMAMSMTNQSAWSRIPELMAWILNCRLDPMTALMRNVDESDQDKIALLQRSRGAAKSAAVNMQKLLGELRASRV